MSSSRGTKSGLRTTLEDELLLEIYDQHDEPQDLFHTILPLSLKKYQLSLIRKMTLPDASTPIQTRYLSGQIPPTPGNIEQVSEVKELILLFRH